MISSTNTSNRYAKIESTSTTFSRMSLNTYCKSNARITCPRKHHPSRQPSLSNCTCFEMKPQPSWKTNRPFTSSWITTMKSGDTKSTSPMTSTTLSILDVEYPQSKIGGVTAAKLNDRRITSITQPAGVATPTPTSVDVDKMTRLPQPITTTNSMSQDIKKRLLFTTKSYHYTQRRSGLPTWV